MVRCSKTNRQEGKDNKNKEEPPIWRLPLEPYRDLHPGSPGRLQPPDRALAGAALRSGVPARWLILLLLLCPHSGDRSSRVDTRRPWPPVLVMSPFVRAASEWTSGVQKLTARWGSWGATGSAEPVPLRVGFRGGGRRGGRLGRRGPEFGDFPGEDQERYGSLA